MALAGLIIAIIGLASSVGSGIYQMLVAKYGSEGRTYALGIAAKIAKKISKNNALLAKLQQAYSEKNQAALNELYKGMGFGPRAESLNRSIASNESSYREALSKVNSQNVELENLKTTAETAAANAGTSWSGNVSAGEQAAQAEAGMEKLPDLEQNIKGGSI